jgi:ABC-type Na+ efflux pump permease subunit
MRRAALRRGGFVTRVAFALSAAALLFVIAAVAPWELPYQSAAPGPSLRAFGQVASIAIAAVLIAVPAMLVSYSVGEAIAKEREKGTLTGLLLTRMTPTEIVVQKLLGRMTPPLAHAAAGLPLATLAGWAAGFPPVVLGFVLIAPLTTVAVAGAIALYRSARATQVSEARGLGLIFGLFWLFLPLFTKFGFPVPYWLADIVAALRAVARFVGLSSPLMLLDDTSWIADSTYGALQGRLLVMFAMQAAVGLLAVLGAVHNLDRREPRSAHMGGQVASPGENRPKCGEDPIIWREYHLPRRAGAFGVWLLLRALWGLIGALLTLLRGILFVALGIFGVLVALSFMAGLMGSALWFAYGAVRESWHYGVSPADPFAARRAFNLYLRVVTLVLGQLLPMALLSSAGASVDLEKSKKTWEVFLTTPLSAAEIVSSKMQAALRKAWPLARFLGILWLAGIVCGAIHPVSAIVSALELAAFWWVVLVLMIRGTLQAGPIAPTPNRFGLGLGVWIVMYAPLVSGALCSPPELTAFAGWAPMARWATLTILTAVPLLTAALAWAGARANVRRFDEWMDRPRPGP